MQGADIAIGVLALVSIVGSVVGVVTYEPDAMPSWEVSVASQTTAPPNPVAMQATLQGSDDASSEWPLAQRNVTAIVFEVAVTGGNARVQPTTVEVTITAPDNRTETVTLVLQAPNSNSATTTVTFDNMAPVPAGGTVETETSDEARATVPQSTNATGLWAVSAQSTVGLPGENPAVTVTATEMTFYTVEVRPEGTDLGEAI